MIDSVYALGQGLMGGIWPGVVWPVLWALIKIVLVLAPLMGCVAYLTLWERKAIGFTQVRLGPNRIGPFGLLQPIADALKLLTKEIIIPTAASKGHHAGPGGLGGGAVRTRGGAFQHECGPAVPDGDYFDGSLWRHHCWLGFELQIRFSGRHARFGPDGQL